MIPTQVILANMFSPAELRVSNYGSMLDVPFSYGTNASFQIAPVGIGTFLLMSVLLRMKFLIIAE